MSYEEQVREVVSKARFGDLIEFSYPVGYSHWGVYDTGGQVIHFAVPDETEVQRRFRGVVQSVVPIFGDILIGWTEIKRQPITTVNVPAGARVKISNYRHSLPRSSEQEMRRRLDVLLGKKFWYDLLKLNCEHFATFVRYGEAVCNQSILCIGGYDFSLIIKSLVCLTIGCLTGKQTLQIPFIAKDEVSPTATEKFRNPEGGSLWSFLTNLF